MNSAEIHKIGTLCQIYNVVPGPEDTLTLLVYPDKRVFLESETKANSTVTVESALKDFADILPAASDGIVSLIQETLDTLGDIAALPPSSTLSAGKLLPHLAKLSDFSASMCDADPTSLQFILECPEVMMRLEKANILLQNELVNAELQSEFRKD
eukprot:Partr_v1_DN28648_c0_g2_i1_m49899